MTSLVEPRYIKKYNEREYELAFPDCGHLEYSVSDKLGFSRFITIERDGYLTIKGPSAIKYKDRQFTILLSARFKFYPQIPPTLTTFRVTITKHCKVSDFIEPRQEYLEHFKTNATGEMVYFIVPEYSWDPPTC
jgi:hypothetical protein